MDFFFHPSDVCSVAKLGLVQLCLLGGVVFMSHVTVAVTRTSRSISKCSANYFPCEKQEKLEGVKWVFSEQLSLSALSNVI